MDDPRFVWTMAGIVALLAVNRLFVRSLARSRAFWALQGLDLVAIGCVLVAGIPGLEGLPVARWVVAGLFALHLAENFLIRARGLDRR